MNREFKDRWRPKVISDDLETIRYKLRLKLKYLQPRQSIKVRGNYFPRVLGYSNVNIVVLVDDDNQDPVNFNFNSIFIVANVYIFISTHIEILQIL